MDLVKQLANAIWIGNLAEVERLIALGADVNSRDGTCYPQLFLAIEQNFPPIIERLIKAGADVNCEVEGGWTPLKNAIDLESVVHTQCSLPIEDVPTVLVEQILQAGAKPTESVFELAQAYRNQKVIDLMHKYNSHQHG